MSHFTVLVCIKDPENDDITKALDAVMAPFDKNVHVDPYKDYEKDGPEAYWYYSHLKRQSEHQANGTGILPQRSRDDFFSSSRTSDKTPEAQREEMAQDAERFAALPVPVTWEALAATYNAEFYPATQVATTDDDDQGAYTITRYNPLSKWDWYQVGGRWSDHFIPRADVDAKHLISGQRSWTMENEPLNPLRCDGGRKGALNLTAMREEGVAKARKRYQDFYAFVEGTPEITYWSAFRERAEAGEITWDQAREEYRSQERMQRLQHDDWFWTEPEEFAITEEVYALKAYARAVPGYSTLTTDGRWMTRGKMGWFGLDDATPDTEIGYLEAANAYIESLDDDVWLIQVDCHI